MECRLRHLCEWDGKVTTESSGQHKVQDIFVLIIFYVVYYATLASSAASPKRHIRERLEMVQAQFSQAHAEKSFQTNRASVSSQKNRFLRISGKLQEINPGFLPFSSFCSLGSEKLASKHLSYQVQCAMHLLSQQRGDNFHLAFKAIPQPSWRNKKYVQW